MTTIYRPEPVEPVPYLPPVVEAALVDEMRLCGANLSIEEREVDYLFAAATALTKELWEPFGSEALEGTWSMISSYLCVACFDWANKLDEESGVCSLCLLDLYEDEDRVEAFYSGPSPVHGRTLSNG